MERQAWFQELLYKFREIGTVTTKQNRRHCCAGGCKHLSGGLPSYRMFGAGASSTKNSGLLQIKNPMPAKAWGF
jgi:hypothetical protein